MFLNVYTLCKLIATGDVWIHSLPSTPGAKCALLYKGNEIERSGEDTAGWYGVLHNGRQRYISRKYAKELGQSQYHRAAPFTGAVLCYQHTGEMDIRIFSMDLIWTKIQMAVTTLGGWLVYFLDRSDRLLIPLRPPGQS